MNVLVPLAITDVMLTSSTVAEPAAGESAWVSGGTYALGDQVIRTSTHRIYEALQAHTGRTALPEVDTDYWLDVGPTQRWAAFDNLISTPSETTGTLTYVLRPGFFNAISLYGLNGDTISITIKDAPGGTVFYTYTGGLTETVPDWYEWLFSPIKPLSKLVLKDILPYPDPELTLTIAAGSGITVGVGMVVIGDYRAIFGDGDWGGTEHGASAEPVTYSYIKTDAFGVTSIVRRHSATDLRVRVVMPREFADYALATVQEVLDVPACWIATDAAGYAGLNVFGLGSGALTYDSFNNAVFALSVKGMT